MMKRNQINKKYLLTGTALVLAAGIFLSVSGFFDNKTDRALPADQLHAAAGEKISGLPADTATIIEYTAGNQIQTANIQSTNDGEFSYQPADDILNGKNQYSVRFTSRLPNDSYIDVNMKINKTTKNIVVDITGLQQEDTASLSVGNFEYYSNVPVDWAGRLTLNTNNLVDLEKSNVCLTAISSTQNTPSIICHSVIRNTGGQTS